LALLLPQPQTRITKGSSSNGGESPYYGENAVPKILTAASAAIWAKPPAASPFLTR
jgi:hypothetical protein